MDFWKIITGLFKIVFELALGAGRAFINDVHDDQGNIADFDFDLDIMGRLAVGYRFGGSKND